MEKEKRNQEEPVETSSMPQTKSDLRQVLELLAALTVGITLLVVSLKVTASYIYEDNQNLFDLTNQTGTTNLNSGDDQLSAAFNLDNSFTFYGTVTPAISVGFNPIFVDCSLDTFQSTLENFKSKKTKIMVCRYV